MINKMETLTQAWDKVFRVISTVELAARELHEAEVRRLEACTAREYADSMVNYHDARIKRLKAYLKLRGESNE